MTSSSYQVLFRFGPRGGRSHGAHPDSGSLIDVNGTLYGTTSSGGGSDDGTVYSITTSGSENILYSFKGGSDGAHPNAGVIDVNGSLYGTTNSGGTSNNGTVYSVSTSGTEKVLYSFAGGSDGAHPQAGLIAVNGTLYGTTSKGGGSGCSNDGCGTVYSITTAGAEKVLYSFKSGSGDGANPEASLIDVSGTLYGTTLWGGDGGGCGCGTVYQISITGAEKILHSFGNYSNTDGEYPEAGLIDVNGTLYGTTEFGGGVVCEGISITCGTVYSVTVSGSEKVLYSFRGLDDGWQPKAGLIAVNGTLYGTTYYGGSGCRCGTVYSITDAGKETVLYSFAGHSVHDGANPVAGLTAVAGTLYGTTQRGGSACKKSLGCGTAFALTP